MKLDKSLNLSKVEEAYKAVKNHPFRTDKIGNPRAYGEAIIKMGEEFRDHLNKRFFNGEGIIELCFNVSHDLLSIGCHFNSIGDSITVRKKKLSDYTARISHNIIIIERYLNQIHSYLDTGVFVQWEGYYAGCNPHPGWYTVKFNSKTKKFKQIKWVKDEECNENGYLIGEKKE